MKGISKDIIKGLLDEAGVRVVYDDDGDMMLLQSADADFGHDVAVFIMVNNNRLSFAAAAPTYHPMGNLLELANRHNCRRNLPTAVVRDGNIRMEATFLLDEEVSKEYIVDNCIKLVLGAIWHAFVSLEDA